MYFYILLSTREFSTGLTIIFYLQIWFYSYVIEYTLKPVPAMLYDRRHNEGRGWGSGDLCSPPKIVNIDSSPKTFFYYVFSNAQKSSPYFFENSHSENLTWSQPAKTPSPPPNLIFYLRRWMRLDKLGVVLWKTLLLLLLWLRLYSP